MCDLDHIFQSDFTNQKKIKPFWSSFGKSSDFLLIVETKDLFKEEVNFENLLCI